MIYLYAVPKALEKYRNLKPRGQATYLDHTVRIPAEAVDDQFIQSLGTLIRRRAPTSRPPECRADRNVVSATSALWTARSVWTKAPSPKAELPATSDFLTWRRCQFEELVRQLPPFTRNSGVLPARGKHKQYALGDRTMRSATALIWIVAALLIACSSESTSPPLKSGARRAPMQDRCRQRQPQGCQQRQPPPKPHRLSLSLPRR